MNLNEIQEILRKQLNVPDKKVKTILEILKIVRGQSYRAKQEIIDLIERDSRK